jgi:hypothetical protein
MPAPTAPSRWRRSWPASACETQPAALQWRGSCVDPRHASTPVRFLRYSPGRTGLATCHHNQPLQRDGLILAGRRCMNSSAGRRESSGMLCQQGMPLTAGNAFDDLTSAAARHAFRVARLARATAVGTNILARARRAGWRIVAGIGRGPWVL